MPMSDDPLLERHLLEEGNQAVVRVSRWSLGLGVFATVLVPVMMWTGVAEGLEVVAGFAAWGALSSGLLHLLARRQRLFGWVAYVAFAVFAQLPTFLFAVSHLFLPGGAATFLTGPMSYLYPMLIVSSACLFRFRIAAVTGASCAVGYFAMAYLAHPILTQVRTPDPIFTQDIASLAIWANKSLMLLFAGFASGAVAVVGQRLAVRVLDEERDKARVRGLFGEYVSDAVVTRLLQDEAAEVGGRKEVVVLFSDIRGFTSYSESAAPEELVERLNAYFDAMVAAVTRHGGVIDKFIGDAVMAVFDGVVPLDDPCDAALAAARDMTRALADLNRRWRGEGRSEWCSGIGIHRGEVVLGSIGSATRKDFTVIGDAVNTAARLEALTKEHRASIIVSGAVQAGLRASHDLSALGTVTLRGKSTPVAIFGVPS